MDEDLREGQNLPGFRTMASPDPAGYLTEFAELDDEIAGAVYLIPSVIGT